MNYAFKRLHIKVNKSKQKDFRRNDIISGFSLKKKKKYFFDKKEERERENSLQPR